MASEVNNVLEVLRVADKEDVVANLIKYCVEHSESFTSAFLEQICGLDASDYVSCNVHARPQVPGSGVPDLVVVCRGTKTDWVIIENKLKAEEGKDQTRRYAEEKAIANLRNGLDIDTSAEEPGFVFLTLFPDQSPDSEKFSSACYSSLLQSRPLDDQDDRLAHQLASAWLELLEEFYNHRDLRPQETISEKLSTDHVLDANFLAFQSFMRELSLFLSSDLELDDLFRQSQRGRKYFGAAFVKRNWVSTSFSDSGDRWTLPEDNRRIHIEPQYDALNHELKVRLHYETHPYHPRKLLEKHVHAEQYESYLARRREFTRFLDSVEAPSFKVREYGNQIASANVPLSGVTVAEARSRVEALIEEASTAIDQAMSAES